MAVTNTLNKANINVNIAIQCTYFRLLLACERIGTLVVIICDKIARNSPQELVAIVLLTSLARNVDLDKNRSPSGPSLSKDG